MEEYLKYLNDNLPEDAKAHVEYNEDDDSFCIHLDVDEESLIIPESTDPSLPFR